MLTSAQLLVAVRRLEEVSGRVPEMVLEKDPVGPRWMVTAQVTVSLAAWRDGLRARWDDVAERIGEGWYQAARDVGGAAAQGAVIITYVLFGEPTPLETRTLGRA